MKPITIELQAFGPFAGTEKVDFKNLSKDGLFLIRGKTGSGKSMILDAICYALFGKSSGANRDSLEDLRCNRCNPEAVTFVRFTFQEKDNVYVFERILKKARKNFSSRAGAYLVTDEGVLEPLFENPKERDVTKKAEEIIGLPFDQFRQVIILPQGKFEKFLTSKSDDKEKILASIFGTEKWHKMAENYYYRAKAEKDRLDEIRKKAESRLEDEGCSSLKELEEKVEAISEKCRKEKKQFKERNTDEEEELLNQQKEVFREFSILHDYKRRKTELDKKADFIEYGRSRLEAAEKAEAFRKPLDYMIDAESSFNKRKKDENNAETIKKTSENELKNAENLLKKHIDKKDEYEKWKKDSADFASRRVVYENLNDALGRKSDAEKNHSRALKELTETQKNYKNCVNETNEAYKAYRNAIDKHKTGLDSYMKGICGTMASELKEGKACPVCGSISHPDKAEIPAGTAAADDVKRLEKNEIAKREIWERADKNRIQFEKVLEEKKEVEMELKTSLNMAAAECLRTKENLIDGIDSLMDFDIKMRDIQNDIKQYETAEKRLRENVQKAALTFKGAQTGWENASEETKKAEEVYARAKHQWFEMIADSDFDSAETARKSMLSEEERIRIRNEIGEYDGQVKEIDKLIEEKKSELEEIEEPDIDKINRRINEIDAEREQFNKSQGAFLREIERINEKISNLKGKMMGFESEMQKAESNLIFAKSLRGDTGIGLQRYVLGILFSSVISAANEMLSKVHGGRYRLYRTDEKVAGSNKKGLDLKVHDSYAEGTEGRTVATLSGGEKFLASLALSLGMSAVARTSGVNIEGMFIDEGFGTLDENSVEDALDILKSIRQMNGSVGIISHMDVLGANIPSQLMVIKEKETSTIRLV